MHQALAVLLYVGVAVVQVAAAAQPDAVRPDPTDSAAAVAQPKYDSAFAGYRSYRDEDIADWRALNDEVARVGGHLGIVGGAGHAAHGADKPDTALSTQPQPARGAPKAAAGARHQH